MRVYVESYGCSQNRGEADGIVRSLHDAGVAIAAEVDRADAAVLVTCGVIGATEARMVRRWRGLARRTPRVVVTGCLVPLRNALFTGPELARTELVPIVAQTRIPEILVGSPPTTAREPVPAGPLRVEAAREVVIAQGCTSHCTYCFSRLARGRLRSRPMAAVRAAVAEAVAAGAVEVRLSSLDTSCWGQDLDGADRLPELLRAFGPAESAPFRIRVGMMSPQSLGPIAEPYLDALAGAPAFRFLHLPVQSGADAVLEGMRRGYDVAEVRRLVAMARGRIPDLTVATDVIVGFPTERPEDLEATLDLLDAMRPAIVNVTRFSARPLTPAALLPPLPPSEVKRRSRRVTERRLALAREGLEAWVGREADAWTVEPGTGGTTVARLENYLPLVLDRVVPLGRNVRVRVDGARSTYLVGRLRP